jgi:hypothetical protein
MPDEPPGAAPRDDASLSHRRVAADLYESTPLSQTSPSPGNRIVEYEKSVAQLIRKKSDGPVFEVIKNARRPDDKSSPITSLPNGASILSTAIVA